MPEIRWNLLTDEIFTIVAAGDSDRPVSLPDVLALLSSDIPIEFAALQPHQFHAWHAFLVQLAAIAVHSAGGYALPAMPMTGVRSCSKSPAATSRGA